MGEFNEVRVSSWQECIAYIKTIESVQDLFNDRFRIWFRCQSDANWSLATTLERCIKGNISLSDYYRKTLKVRTAIESLGERRWVVPSWPEIDKLCRSFDTLRNREIPAYDLLAYTRHHGFPSPLLDWSHSPFVAAYFAFENAGSGDVAIYAYSEQMGDTKSYSSMQPQIITAGPYVTTHHRHFRQQASYTLALSFFDGEWHFAPHEDVFNNRDSELQDQLWKIVIPSTERSVVLRELDRYNLNAYSLFGTEDSLMTTLAFRAFNIDV